MYNMNSGYNGYSMSKRAVQAYDNGEKPLSKWTKQEILDEVEYLCETVNFDLIKKLTKDELINECLTYSSWHHTSTYCNSTSFYKIDEESISKLNDEYILDIIRSRQPKEKKVKVTNIYITAKVMFDNWEGSRKHPKKVRYTEVVKYMSNELIVNTSVGNKRLSSLTILNKVENDKMFLEMD